MAGENLEGTVASWPVKRWAAGSAAGFDFLRDCGVPLFRTIQDRRSLLVLQTKITKTRADLTQSQPLPANQIRLSKSFFSNTRPSFLL